MGAYAIILGVLTGAAVTAGVAFLPLRVFHQFVLAEDARKAARILELETQVASQHAKGIPIADPENRVADAPVHAQLPREAEEFIDGLDSPEAQANREKSAALAREKGVEAIADAMLPKMFAPATYAAKPGLVAEARAIMAATPLNGVVGDLLGMKVRPDSTALLPQIDRPVLVIHGQDDQLIPSREAEATHAALPNARLVLVPNAGHLLNLEQPETFNAEVRTFLQSLGA
jgi:pimeloyl-ACP methyl ester carboxylesterase